MSKSPGESVYKKLPLGIVNTDKKEYIAGFIDRMTVRKRSPVKKKKVIGKAKAGDGRIGNQFWKLRSKHGRDKLFATPEALWDAACEYFRWCESHPLKEMKAFAYQGVVTTKSLPKMRAMTMSQLCFYLHCNEAYFRTFKHQLPEGEQDFNTVIADIEKVIYNQKFQGAAADLLNANIIARDLGLSDKTELTGKDGKDLIPPARILTKAEAKEFLKTLENEC